MIGHDQLKAYFISCLQQENLAHGFLFVGPQQVGKHHFAIQLTKLLLCEHKPDTFDACGNCFSCREFDKIMHPDLMQLSKEDEKHQISIKQIRELQSSIHKAPVIGRRKVAIINDAHYMTPAAQNAFLKTLEEPPKSSIVILITHKPDYLLATVHSRCQRLEFNKPQEQPLEIDDNQLWQQAHALPGKYYQIQNQEMADQEREEINLFWSLVNSSNAQRFALLEGLFKKGNKHSNEKEKWMHRLWIWQQGLRTLLLSELRIDTKPAEAHKSYSPKQLQCAIDHLTSVEAQISRNVSIRPAIERFFLSYM